MQIQVQIQHNTMQKNKGGKWFMLLWQQIQIQISEIQIHSKDTQKTIQRREVVCALVATNANENTNTKNTWWKNKGEKWFVLWWQQIQIQISEIQIHSENR